MRTVSLPLVVVALLLTAIVPGRADEFKPAYLQLTQLDQDTYDVLWKIPAIDESTTLKVKPQFPDGTEALTEVRSTFSRGVTVLRWRIRVPDGLDGKAIFFSQLSETRIDVLARLVRLDGSVQLERILPVSPRFVGKPSPGSLEVVKTYTVLGIEHILTGFDHLLYVLGMLILVGGWRRVVVTMSAFTATHSLTLTASALGWVHVPQPPVEACIALSILFVAREIVQVHRGRPGITARWPWVVSFTFGLMHGFGFAGALAEVGLPQSSIPIALLFFNVGVEIGQLMFVAAVLTVIAVGRRAAQRLRVPQPPGSGASRRMPLARSRASGSSNESPRSDHTVRPSASTDESWYQMVARKLLIVTALVETATGLILLVSPTLVVAFLLGASLDAPAALVVARMAGAAVLSLGCACWLARNDPPRGAARALVAAMLLYNVGAVVVLGDAGIVRLSGSRCGRRSFSTRQ